MTPIDVSAINKLFDRWNTTEGRPYKGRLIDWDAYGKDGLTPPDNIGCMCAQGQALHLLAGWTPAKLRSVEQSKADEATAELFNISRAHAVLLRQINDKVDGAPTNVLTNPWKIIGDQWRIILGFWLHLDSQCKLHLDALTSEQRATARIAARTASWAATGLDVEPTTEGPVSDIGVAAAWASLEIQGAELMREGGYPFFFLPLFGFATPEDVPVLPSNYGLNKFSN